MLYMSLLFAFTSPFLGHAVIARTAAVMNAIISRGYIFVVDIYK